MKEEKKKTSPSKKSVRRSAVREGSILREDSKGSRGSKARLEQLRVSHERGTNGKGREEGSSPKESAKPLSEIELFLAQTR